MSHPPASATQKRPEYVTLIAVYQFITAGILFLLSCLIPAVLFPAILFYVEPSEGVFGSFALATSALALFIGFGFASIIVGWGLLRMREWARMGAIVLAAFALIGFPIWTIVAILVLVYMTSDEARLAFATYRQPETGDPRYHDALAARAAYKAEPPPRAGVSPLDDTRPMTSVADTREASGGRVSTPPDPSESHQIAPIPMPPPSDPAEATESFYDEEADVTDHYRRWKATLEQVSEATPEPIAEAGAGAVETSEVKIPPPDTADSDEQPPRKWFRPPEEAAMDDRINRPREREER